MIEKCKKCYKRAHDGGKGLKNYEHLREIRAKDKDDIKVQCKWLLCCKREHSREQKEFKEEHFREFRANDKAVKDDIKVSTDVTLLCTVMKPNIEVPIYMYHKQSL